MFKRCLAILLITALTAASFQRYFIYAGFALNKSYIAKNLCVNRSRPSMHCNGQCYFMRKLKAAQENEKKQAEKDHLIRLNLSFFEQQPSAQLLSPLIAGLPAADLPAYRSLYHYSFSASLLQPPRLSA